MAIELGMTTDFRSTDAVDALVDAARGAGFTALGINGDRLDATAVDVFAAAGMRCREVTGLIVTDDADAVVARAERMAERAAALGSSWVLTSLRTPLSEETAATIERCAAIVAGAGARMAVEFMPLGPVTSIRSALEVVAVAGTARAGILIDSWHFCRLDSTWDDLEQVPLEQIAYVQFADALAPESDDVFHETTDRRAMPGEGVLELDRFASTLLGRGWEGFVTVEVLNEELRALPLPVFAQRAYDTTSPYWR